MAEYATALGLPRDALFVEEESRDTIGNAYSVMRRSLASAPSSWMCRMAILSRSRA